MSSGGQHGPLHFTRMSWGDKGSDYHLNTTQYHHNLPEEVKGVGDESGREEEDEGERSLYCPALLLTPQEMQNGTHHHKHYVGQQHHQPHHRLHHLHTTHGDLCGDKGVKGGVSFSIDLG